VLKYQWHVKICVNSVHICVKQYAVSIELKFPNSNHAFRYYIWYESAYYLIRTSFALSHVDL